MFDDDDDDDVIKLVGEFALTLKANGDNIRQLIKFTRSKLMTKRFAVVRRLGVIQNAPIASTFINPDISNRAPTNMSPIILHLCILINYKNL